MNSRLFIKLSLCCSLVVLGTAECFAQKANGGKKTEGTEVVRTGGRKAEGGKKKVDDGSGRVDKNVSEWIDKSSGCVVQTYRNLETGRYCMQIRPEGYRNVAPVAELEAVDESAKEYANAEGWKSWFEERTLKVTGPDGFSFSGNKSRRTSPSLGEAAPEGAVVLFDGKDLSEWGAVQHKEWLTWSYEASEKAIVQPYGAIELVPGNQSIISKKKFGSIKHLHIEFRLLGEKTNGGVYMMSRWEFNIKDAWCITSGDPCCAVGNVPGAPVPEFNYALPPMAWQTLDVNFTAPVLDAEGNVQKNARATVYHNGQLLLEDVELGQTKGAGGGRTPIATEGPIYLQEHGTAYQFRNIWVEE